VSARTPIRPDTRARAGSAALAYRGAAPKFLYDVSTLHGVEWCTIARVGRTNVVIDDELIERVMHLYGLRTKREAIDFALRAVAGDKKRRDMLDLEGSGWTGDLEEMRRTRAAGQ
jgi:Arc/MetJ family transcription regulator